MIMENVGIISIAVVVLFLIAFAIWRSRREGKRKGKDEDIVFCKINSE